MKTTEEMVQLNREQAKYSDAIQLAEEEKGHGGYAENRYANLLTRAWSKLRYRQQAAVKQAGVETMKEDAHARWIYSKSGGDFLELGCFSGSPSTFLLVDAAETYLGIDLSPRAAKSLEEKFAKRGLAHKASAKALDFLTMDEARKFDLIYAHGVLHHFENPRLLFKKLAVLTKQDGVLLFAEPSSVNLVYSAVRALFRPFQSDAAWEWPFQRSTVEALEQHFAVVEGFGWGRRSLPLSVLIGLPLLGGFVTDAYICAAKSEVAQGWHPKVWHNSVVTALYRLRDCG